MHASAPTPGSAACKTPAQQAGDTSIAQIPAPIVQVTMPPPPVVSVAGVDVGSGNLLINVTAGEVATLDATNTTCSFGPCIYAW